ncbi:MAG: winged helix-turn-helix domain-containing protein [Amphiplicatus sp.]
MEDERTNSGAIYRYRFGSAEFDEARFELRVGGLPVELERRPLEVLAVLLRHADEIVTKEELLETVWAGRVTVENVLANAVAKLRKGLGETNAELIRTQPRAGYRFSGPVERVAVGRRLANRLELKTGQQVPSRPHFILREQLAGTRGSEVWLARHDKTGEPRVYKFSPDGARLSSLKREATLSRVMRETFGDREDIARVIDWNFETAPYFLECEHGGANLADWAEKEGRLAGMTLAERLNLALQTIEAVAAAHEIGVLHKDLKPTNVLVAPGKEGAWRIRIADFGAGSLLEPARLDELGVTPLGLTLDEESAGSTSLGTPLYIAPEIIAGQAPTARSDVYSLGVLLYQILAGDIRKPLTTGWEDNIGDALLREDIAAATNGDPARRLSSAAILAEKLRTLDARRAENALLEEAEQRAAEAQRDLDRIQARRPWIAATLAALAVGMIISLWLYVRASDARRIAEGQTARLEATGAFLLDLLVNADPHAPGGGGSVTVREALDRAVAAIDTRFAADPATEASIRLTAGDIYAGLADYAAAADHRRRAAALLEEMYGAQDRRTLEARYRLGEALANASYYEEAGKAIDDADKDAASLLEKDAALGLAAALARGRHYLLQADIEPAAAQFEEALRLLALANPDDAPTSYRLRMDLSQCYSRLGRGEEAIEILADLQNPQYATKGVSDASRASASLYYGAAFLYAGRFDEAEPQLLKAIESLSAVFGPDSPQVVEARSSLGNLYATSGRWADALPVISAVREYMCALHGREHLTCMMAAGNEGVIELQLGDAVAAAGKIAPARDAFERRLGATSPGVHVLSYYLALAKIQIGDINGAAALATALDPAKLESGSPGEQWDARVRALNAQILLAQDETEQGADALRLAVDDMRRNGVQDWIVAPYERALSDYDALP